jgi:hypothetical protein
MDWVRLWATFYKLIWSPCPLFTQLLLEGVIISEGELAGALQRDLRAGAFFNQLGWKSFDANTL